MGRRSGWGMWVVVVCVASVPGWGAERQGGGAALGLIRGSAAVEVNAQPLVVGATVFAGDVVRTGPGGTALLELRAGVSAQLGEQGEAVVAGAERLELRRGALVVRSAPGKEARVEVLGAVARVGGEPGLAALCTVAALGARVAVLNERGRVEIQQGAGAPRRLAPGQMARLEAGGPQAAGQRAGQVSAAIPAEKVRHVGQTAELPLQVRDAVAWEDLVTTERTGRVRIALEDGTFLNIGARSQMRIVKHDAARQQTQVELTLGRLRGEVVKLTKPGAEFQVKTQTAVIGVVGTVFVVQAAANYTRVWCMSGTVAVQNINGAVSGAATLHAGQATTVPRGLPPTAAVQAPVGQMVSEVSATSAGESLAPQVSQALQTLGATPAQVSAAASPAVTAAAGAPAGTAATSAVTTTAGAAGAAAGGVAASRAGAAEDTLANTATSLTTASTTANAAAAAANAATTASGAAANALGSLTQEILSPSQPCGCY
jgi:hypothetical protein